MVVVSPAPGIPGLLPHRYAPGSMRSNVGDFTTPLVRRSLKVSFDTPITRAEAATKDNLALDAPPEETTCSSRPEHLDVPRYPATWQIASSGAAIPSLCHTSAVFSSPEGIQVVWNSRGHRKGKCPKIAAADGSRITLYRPPFILLNFDARNISWWIGAISTVASAAWVAHGYYLLAPVAERTAHFLVIGWTSVVGNLLFLVAAYLGLLEYLNPCPSIRRSFVLLKEYPRKPVEVGERECQLSAMAVPNHSPVQAAQYSSAQEKATPLLEAERLSDFSGKLEGKSGWRFWGWHPHCIGYLSNLITLVGSAVLCVTCVSGFHPITETLSDLAVTLLFWVPEVLASAILVVSPVLGMLEVQETWAAPKLTDLGWHSAFWNLLGALGFLVGGLLGFGGGDPNLAPLAVEQSLFLGGVAFVIGSAATWLEVMNPYDLWE